MIHLSRINHCLVKKCIARSKTVRRCVSPKSSTRHSREVEERAFHNMLEGDELLDMGIDSDRTDNVNSGGCDTAFC